MEVQSVTAAATPAASGAQPMGVSAQLADARSRLRAAVPAGSWDAVLEEVRRVQTERSLPLLAALHVVYEKLASGWTPHPRR